MKRVLLSISVVAILFSMVAIAAGERSWTGEVIDLACYVNRGARGADHGGCAKSCVKNGQPMGLLTDDGTLVLLVPHNQDSAPYEALKSLAGDRAVVGGKLAEKDGMKVVTVTGSKAAS